MASDCARRVRSEQALLSSHGCDFLMASHTPCALLYGRGCKRIFSLPTHPYQACYEVTACMFTHKLTPISSCFLQGSTAKRPHAVSAMTICACMHHA